MTTFTPKTEYVRSRVPQMDVPWGLITSVQILAWGFSQGLTPDRSLVPLRAISEVRITGLSTRATPTQRAAELTEASAPRRRREALIKMGTLSTTELWPPFPIKDSLRA